MPATWEETWDVVVCGAGMAGLCTAVSALEAGASVLVIEKGPQPGGSMRMSGGTVWTAPSMEVVREWVPAGDFARMEVIVDGIAPGLEWLDRQGVRRGNPIDSPRQIGTELDVEELTHRMAARIEALGGWLATKTALESLERDDEGAIQAVVVRSEGSRRRIATRSVVLATGGFGGNRELMVRYVSHNADRLMLRANPYSVGDAFLAATAIGARTSPNLSTFYGHTMPGLPADPPQARWTSVTAYYTQDTVLVNERGERFFDESTSMSDEKAPSEIIQQANGRAFLILDDAVYSDAPIPGRSPSEVRVNFDGACEFGAPNTIANSLPELAASMATWGVSPRGLLATLQEYNDAVTAGRGGELRIPRRSNQIPVAVPPFRALEVRAGVTFTLGGIEADTLTRVIDRDGLPIPGLYAAGADAGGTWQVGYMGGLVLGLVQGRIAGREATAFARSITP